MNYEERIAKLHREGKLLATGATRCSHSYTMRHVAHVVVPDCDWFTRYYDVLHNKRNKKLDIAKRP